MIAACARPRCETAQYREIARQASRVNDWSEVVTQAEVHGVAPLVYQHLVKSGVVIDEAASIQLRLSTLRHRFANRVRMGVLADILECLSDTGIATIVLKGGALANVLYSEPGLRPMQDLDLLVKPEEAASAQQLLSGLGFHVPPFDHHKRRLSHELPAASLSLEGVRVAVEIHYDVFTWGHPLSLTWGRIRRPLQVFCVGDRQAQALGHEEMMLHLCHHLVTLGQPLRFIGVSDIIGYAQRFCEDIDWELVARDYPFVLNTLGLLALLAPLPEDFARARGITVRRVPADVGLDYCGWPHTPFHVAKARRHGMRRLFVDSLSAPDWWLRLHYGLADGDSVILCRYTRHPARLAKLGIQWLLGRL